VAESSQAVQEDKVVPYKAAKLVLQNHPILPGRCKRGPAIDQAHVLPDGWIFPLRQVLSKGNLSQLRRFVQIRRIKGSKQ
jgi:hypothetical protein